MKITDIIVFNGRNIYSHKKCIRLDLDLEGFSEIPSSEIQGFNEKLLIALPELKKHCCCYGREGGFEKRLIEGTYLSHICEHTTIALQNKLGIDVMYGKAREIKGEHYYIIYQYEYRNMALECGKLAVEIINLLINKNEIKLESRLREISSVLKKEELGVRTLSICNAAKKKGIPIIPLGESLIQLGYGKHSHIVEATIGSKTSAVAVDISCDKLISKEILKRQCIPVPPGNKICNTLELLVEAEIIGYPVVLKPRFGNHGSGVIIDIENEKELINAYQNISKSYKDILVEKYIKGKDFRICVVNGKVICVAERIPPFVVGDGKSTIKSLIQKINSESNRGDGHEKELTKIKIDSELEHCINKNGYSINSILNKGMKIYLRDNANISTGGVAIDRTDAICQENIDICKRTAKAIGLDICGIDICCRDISKPIGKNDAIIEVNASPGIRMHQSPSVGKSHNVAGEIIDMIFKEDLGSIPIVSVTGTNGKTTTSRLICYAMSLAGYKVGMATTGGIYINNKCILKGDTTGPRSAMTILTNKEIDAAVLETARGGIIREGLAYDLADVGVITNITEDHLGIDGIETLDELAKVKALVGEAVKEEGYVVLNADDEVSKSIVSRFKSRIIFFSKNKENPLLKEGIFKGGMAVYVNEGFIYIENSKEKIKLISVEDISITIQGNLVYNMENAMSAVAALKGLNISSNIIVEALLKFKGDADQNPGRFNIYDLGNALVILDYGHNIEGYKAVIQGVRKMKHKRLVGIIGVPGDRLNSNVIEVGRIAGESFHSIYIKEDRDRRGRKVGEIAELLKQGAYNSSIDRKNVKVVLEEKEALKIAIENSEAGDIIIIFFEKYEPLVELVEDFIVNSQNNKNRVNLA